MSPRALALGTLLCGLGVVGLSFVFVSMGLRPVEPLNGAYADQAILAFELARTPEELARVIGPNPPNADAQDVRAAMDRANRIDFAYMALYGAFIALACALAAARRGRRWLLAGVALGALAALADLFENLVMLQLTQPDADVLPLLESLRARTLLKWELLAATTALFAAGFVGGGRLGTIAGAIVALLAVAGGVLTLVDPARFLQVLSGAITLAWLWQLGYAAWTWRQLRRSR